MHWFISIAIILLVPYRAAGEDLEQLVKWGMTGAQFKAACKQANGRWTPPQDWVPVSYCKDATILGLKADAYPKPTFESGGKLESVLADGFSEKQVRAQLEKRFGKPVKEKKGECGLDYCFVSLWHDPKTDKAFMHRQRNGLAASDYDVSFGPKRTTDNDYDRMANEVH